MNAFRIKPMTYPWPPLLFGLAAATALILDLLLPIPLTHDGGAIAEASGYALVAAAIAVDIWAIKTLIERKTAVLPHHCTHHLVTCGPFRLSRNPIYLGYTTILAGVGLIDSNAWCFVMAIVFVVTMSFHAIHQEELHLLSRFGVDFERYSRRTARWI